MSQTTGKSGVDWSEAPEGATHYKYSLFYRQHLGVWEYHCGYWRKSSNTDSGFKDAISKEEDLGMTEEVTKQVRSIEDLEVGMFLKSETGNIVVVTRDAGCINKIKFFTCSDMDDGHIARNAAGKEYYSKFHSWSYTYNGEYTPIVKETEAERKIKELEETIELAQKQLQEYKEMK